MDEGVGEDSVRQMEDLIARLPAVLRANIVVNDWGGIEEIHVLTSLERTAKQVVRDVESALGAQWGIHVDHKRISVAQIRTDDIIKTRHFLTLREVTMDVDTLEGNARGTVELEPVDEEAVIYRGEWSGRYVPSQHIFVVAHAAVQALNGLPELSGGLVLSEIRNIEIGHRQVILAALSYMNPNGREELLLGTALDSGDSAGSTVVALVDAVNRWMIRQDIERSDDPLLPLLLRRIAGNPASGLQE